MNEADLILCPSFEQAKLVAKPWETLVVKAVENKAMGGGGGQSLVIVLMSPGKHIATAFLSLLCGS